MVDVHKSLTIPPAINERVEELMKHDLMALAYIIDDTSTRKGFKRPSLENMSEKLMLTSDELSEAHEIVRDANSNHDLPYYWFNEAGKPEGFPIEIADAVIRLCHICAALGINLKLMMALKIAYNESRPAMHGRKF